MIMFRKLCKIERYIVANTKSYVACRLASLPVTLSDLNGSFRYLKHISNSNTPGNLLCIRPMYDILCQHMN